VSTVTEIQAALPKLSDQELRQIEASVRELYRSRKVGIIYDDAYGVWTEEDQISAAAEAFAVLDKAEAANERSKAR
jgi:hypothetical protein